MTQAHIIITAKNVAKWAQWVATQACMQDYEDLVVHWIDDCSTDATYELLRYVGQNFPAHRFLLTSPAPLGLGCRALPNLRDVVMGLPADHVVITWDGDDFFAGQHVVETIMRRYRRDDGSDNPDVWMTYGGYRCWPSFLAGLPPGGYPKGSHPRAGHRWVCEPPRSFRAGLLQSVPRPEFQDPLTGQFWTTAWDQALYIPMLELAGCGRSGHDHTRYIPDVLYLYNEGNPQNDFRIRAQEQREAAMRVHQMPRLEPLTRLS